MSDDRFFQALNYSSQNEDWRAEAQALALQDGQRILAITGSGDRAVNLLAMADVSVLAVDAAPAQNHLLRVKMAALRLLPYDAYVAFLGLTRASGDAREAWAATLDLEKPTRAWLHAHRRDLRSGLLYCGRFERWFAGVGALARLIRGPAIRTLLAFDDLEAQRRFLAERWDHPAWRAVWQAVCHPCVTRITMGDPAFYRRVAVPVGATLFDRIRQGLEHVLARDSFMVHLVLMGTLSPHDLPPYLQEICVPTIRQRLDQIEVVDGDVTDAIRRPGPLFDGLSLSDLPSFLPPAALNRLLRAAADHTRPGGRIVLRQFLTRDDPATPAGLRRLPELEVEVAQSDRTFSYAFLIYEVDRDVEG